jgi:hypothetical protein
MNPVLVFFEKHVAGRPETAHRPQADYTFLGFTVPHDGVEQVFKPAVKLVRPSGFSH